MAGKRGMKHLRGKTREERDEYALIKMEQFIDTHSLCCDECKKKMNLQDLHPTVVTMMMKRYDKLRPSLSAMQATITNVSFINEIERIQGELDQAPAQPVATQQSSDIVH